MGSLHMVMKISPYEPVFAYSQFRISSRKIQFSCYLRHNPPKKNPIDMALAKLTSETIPDHITIPVA